MSTYMYRGFRPIRMLDGSIVPAPTPWVLYNSVTFREGSAVRIHGSGNGIDVSDAASDNILGYLDSFVVKNIPLELVSNNSSYVNGTTTSAPTGLTYAARSTNLTTDRVQGLVYPAMNLVVSAYPDSAPGTTTGSNEMGWYFDIETTAANRATYLDESTVTATKANYLSVSNNLGGESCLDPNDTRRILVIAVETQQSEAQ